MSQQKREFRLCTFADLKQLDSNLPPASPGSASDESVETFRQFRRHMIEASNLIEKLSGDFTSLDFDDDREQRFKDNLLEVADLLYQAVEVREHWFNARVTLTEGGVE